MELLNLYTALLRRKWLLLQALVFFTIAGALTALALPKSYKATAKMAISTSDVESSILSDLGLQEMAVSLSGASDDIQNHIAMATTRPILEEVIHRLQLRDSDGSSVKYEKLLVPGLESSYSAPPYVEVKQYNGTDIIAVTAYSNSPELSRLMSDTLVRVYIAETTDKARQETREARSFIVERMKEVRKEFDSALELISDVQVREQVIDLESEIRSAVLRQSELVMASEENSSKVQEVRAQILAFKRQQNRESSDYMSPGTVSQNADIRGLRESITQAEQSRANLLLDKTERHPDVVRVDRQIEVLRQQLDRALEQQHGLDPGILTLEAELSGLMNRGEEIKLAIGRTTNQFAQYPEKLRKLSELQLAADVAEEVYRSLQEQSYQIAIAEEMTTAPLQFVEPSTKPERHISPKLAVNTVVGMALGLLVGLGLVVLFEYVDDSIKGPDDLREIWDIPQLGIIPKYKAGVGVTIADFDPVDPVFEAFRTLRSSISYAALDRPARMMMITSSIPSEGKSTVLSSLGVSIAHEDDTRRVLLVDCDLRRPTQHKFWPKAHNRVGVTSVLKGDSTLKDAIQKTSLPNLDLLTSGTIPPNPGKLVESLKLRQLLLELTREYDLVLIDAPPVLVVNDSLLMARLVDHVLMVVESSGTPRRIIAEARNRLAAGGIEPLGAILNKLDYSLAGYGYYKSVYQTYYTQDGGSQATGGAA